MPLTIAELSKTFRVAGRRPRPQLRGRLAGRLGEVIPTRGSQADAWSLPGVAAELARGFRYAQPYQATSAYVDRKFELTAPWYTDEAATEKDWSAQNAAVYPQVQVQFQQPWTAPFPFLQQPVWNAGVLPIWGTPWSFANPPVVAGQGPAQLPVAGPGGFPTPGQSIEKF